MSGSAIPEDDVKSYLEQFLLLAKNTTGKATVAVIMQVLKHKSIFVFAELLNLPCVRNLQGSEHEQWFKVLQLFSYGTYSDYRKDKDAFPDLTEEHILKLKQLTLISSAGRKSVLKYEELMELLEIKEMHELENLIISCIYNRLIHGRMDQRGKKLYVDWAMGRDLRPGELEDVLQKLGKWKLFANNLLHTLERNVKDVEQEISAEKKEENRLGEALVKVKKELQFCKESEKDPEINPFKDFVADIERKRELRRHFQDRPDFDMPKHL